MCGIVGYIGNRPTINVLMKGLSNLEYRGYDSAGVAILHPDEIKIVKSKGHLQCLREKIENEAFEGTFGIAHTRWATHGEPNDVNSHPHISFSGRIAVVHNGIIENYNKIKDFLKNQGIECISETDTEVVSHLIDYYYDQDLISSILKALNDIEGSYALGIICKDYNDQFIVVRKNSPLIIGLGENENFIASDIPAILEYTRDIYILENQEFAIIKQDAVTIFDFNNNKINREIFKVTWNSDAAEKNGFDHFMMKEICEEPKVLRDTFQSRIKNGDIHLNEINFTKKQLNNIEKIYIVACGTSYHAGLVAKYLIESLVKIPVEIDVASEFRYRDPIVNKKTLAIFISQSGETIDTLFALREAKNKGAHILSIVNVVGSSIARESNNVLYTIAGPEIAVASTKSYNSQLALLYLIAIYFANKKQTINKQKYQSLLNELLEIPSMLDEIILKKQEILTLSSKFYNANSIFFIGRGLDYALSMEGSLKLKEISYIHSESYAGGELKHGTIALIEQGTLVVCPLTQDHLYEKMISNIREVKARGAIVMIITQNKNIDIHNIADITINIPDISSLLSPMIAITPLQLFAYYIANRRNCNIDKPRNLAKSVTVE